MFEEETKIEQTLNVNGSVGLRKQLVSLYYFWPRQWVASMAWVSNDFAFYGNKLQQGVFLGILFPGVSAACARARTCCQQHVRELCSI